MKNDETRNVEHQTFSMYVSQFFNACVDNDGDDKKRQRKQDNWKLNFKLVWKDVVEISRFGKNVKDSAISSIL